MKLRRALAFDDVLLVPRKSEIPSRLAVDPSVDVGGIKLGIPLISSPMDTVTEGLMAKQLGLLGGLGIIHRYCSVSEQIAHLRIPIAAGVYGGFAIGVGAEAEERFSMILEEYGSSLDVVCIDIANGHSTLMERTIKKVRDMAPDISIMAGNVATRDGYRFLADLGVNSVRVGIGGGSICKTRIQTGFGVPTFSSLLWAADAKESGKYEASIIADGGIRHPGDLAKSIAAGADAVICGSIFAGSKEAPGDVITWTDGIAYKKYRGMASEEIQVEKRGGMKPGTCAEGTSTLVRYEGSMKRVTEEFEGGIRSALTYNGSWDIPHFQVTAEFIEITDSGLRESHSHGTRK
jgi:IMP dehydrogenase